jgi:hypothetical protein
MLPDFERADRIGEVWGYPESRAFAELLVDCEEDWTLRAVLVGVLREDDRNASPSYTTGCSRTCSRPAASAAYPRMS